MKPSVSSKYSARTINRNKMLYTDEYFMKRALHEAFIAKCNHSVPIGAVIVRDNVVLSGGYNKKNILHDATAHAEIEAIRNAGKKVGPNLDRCVLYTTLKPCLMCLCASYWAHISRIVYGAGRRAGVSYFVTKHDHSMMLIHDMVMRSIHIEGGVLRHECLAILQK